ncbi:MAG: hypothetical protein WD875_03065 [Pirellulales bacterium]
MHARNVDLPLEFSPTSSVSGRMGIWLREAKLRTWSMMTSKLMENLAGEVDRVAAMVVRATIARIS